MTSFKTCKQIAFSIAIALMVPMLIFTGLDTFYPTPQLIYASQAQIQATPTKTTADKTATNKATTNNDITIYHPYSPPTPVSQNAVKDHRTNSFLIALILGLACLIGGSFLGKDAIASGLIFGGLITVFINYLSTWNFALSSPMKFLSLLIVFVVFLIIAALRLKD